MSADAVVIVGAGPAGTRAAETLARAGLRPVVVDEAPASGGQIYRRPPPGFARRPEDLYGFEAAKARAVHAAFDALKDRIDYRPDTLVWEIREGKVHTIANADNRRAEVAYGALILATGAMDRVVPFPGWTLPGVFTLGGAQIALKYQGCGIGSRVVFAGSSPLLYLVAYQYAKAGAAVAAVIDTGPFGAKLQALPDLVAGGATFAKGVYYTAWLRMHGVPIAHGATLLRAEGADGIARLVWRAADGTERTTDCDALGFGFGLKSEAQLADLVGVPFVFDEGQRQFVPQADPAGRTPVPGVYVCGDGAGIRGADAAELAGERAALALLEDRGLPHDRARAAAIDARLARLARFRRGLERAFPFPEAMARAVADDTVLCRCEAVTAGETRRWMRELGAAEMNRVKAFSRVGMGRCQGRVCGPSAAEIVAGECGLPLAQVGRLRGQPPVKPIPLDPGPDE
jgi:NADPH-dependent 2,4-dienoyl-CoA reductase/sulfur reductase-like enzyme